MCRETQQQCTCYSRVATLSVSCHVTSRDADQVSWLEEPARVATVQGCFQGTCNCACFWLSSNYSLDRRLCDTLAPNNTGRQYLISSVIKRSDWI